LSTAWRGDLVLWREPPSAVLWRIGRRSLLPALAAASWLLGMPSWLSIVLSVFALVPALLIVLALVNLVKNKRVLLVLRGSGAIEWPTSVQEVVLRRDADFVAGPEVTVTPHAVLPMGAASEPRVTLTAGETEIPRLPLHGIEPAAFVEVVNTRLAGRDCRLVLAEQPASTSDA
jgi:hypothetical protein